MNSGTMNNDKKRVVCIGGGTGTFVVLRGLKYHPIHLAAIVAMSDSGGSNKRIRDEFGLLPTSDIRQCFVALSEEDRGVGLLRKLFMYRFEKGTGISGMTFGNLFMAALTDILGSQREAIQQTGKVLKINGQVLPVSYTPTNLFAEYENHHVVTEEHFIDEPVHDGKLAITRVWLEPKAESNPDAVKAIGKADMIVLGPGDLYTSVIPNLLVHGIVQAISKSKAKIVYVMNLMTKYGQTYQFSAQDHIRTIEQYLERPVDAIVLSSSPIPKRALHVYAKHHEYPVMDDFSENQRRYAILRGDIISDAVIKKSESDHLVRSLIRHDSKKLADVLWEYIQSL